MRAISELVWRRETPASERVREGARGGGTGIRRYRWSSHAHAKRLAGCTKCCIGWVLRGGQQTGGRVIIGTKTGKLAGEALSCALSTEE